jgi:hypothetical protein
MALRIEKAFGVSMDTLLRMQAWHASHAMRQRAAEIDVKRYEPAWSVAILNRGLTNRVPLESTRVRSQKAGYSHANAQHEVAR